MNPAPFNIPAPDKSRFVSVCKSIETDVMSKEKPSRFQRGSGLGNKAGLKVKPVNGRAPNVIPEKSPVAPTIDADGKVSAVAVRRAIFQVLR